MADVMSKGKEGKESQTRYKYKVKLVAERMTEASQDSYSNSYMEWGIENEQFACIAYEAAKEVFLEKTGFWLHPTTKWVGVSPDRLVGDDGLVEVKCPATTTHLNYIFDGKVPAEYVKQIQAQLWVTGREWCDFISFDPRLPRRNQLFVVRCGRDEKLIKEMEAETIKFLDEVEKLIIQLGE
jgi:predicted phage-related endonuclease